ncbi:hypothetical protein BDDG_09972, partial [Blastomyces dermatitidis ATCC 18188]
RGKYASTGYYGENGGRVSLRTLTQHIVSFPHVSGLRLTNIYYNNRGALLCIGGPLLVEYVRPTEEELFQVRQYIHYPHPITSASEEQGTSRIRSAHVYDGGE